MSSTYTTECPACDDCRDNDDCRDCEGTLDYDSGDCDEDHVQVQSDDMDTLDAYWNARRASYAEQLQQMFSGAGAVVYVPKNTEETKEVEDKFEKVVEPEVAVEETPMQEATVAKKTRRVTKKATKPRAKKGLKRSAPPSLDIANALDANDDASTPSDDAATKPSAKKGIKRKASQLLDIANAPDADDAASTLSDQPAPKRVKIDLSGEIGERMKAKILGSLCKTAKSKYPKRKHAEEFYCSLQPKPSQLQSMGLSAGKMMSSAERLAYLQKDEWILAGSIQPRKATCKGCLLSVSLEQYGNAKSRTGSGEYYATFWNKHREICDGVYEKWCEERGLTP